MEREERERMEREEREGMEREDGEGEGRESGEEPAVVPGVGAVVPVFGQKLVEPVLYRPCTA